MKLRKIYVVLLVGSFSFQTYAQAVSNIDGSSNVENPVGNLNIGAGGGRYYYKQYHEFK